MARDRQLRIGEAAAACGVSDETIRRRLRGGLLPHAEREHLPSGPWRIPLSDLIAAGLNPDTRPGATSPAFEELTATRADLEAARIQLARAETLAAARLDELRAVRAHLDDLRQLLHRSDTSDREVSR